MHVELGAPEHDGEDALSVGGISAPRKSGKSNAAGDASFPWLSRAVARGRTLNVDRRLAWQMADDPCVISKLDAPIVQCVAV